MGFCPIRDVSRLGEWGREIKRRFENPLAETSGDGTILELNLPQKETVNQIIIQENIKKGERVRSYVLESEQNGSWVQICEGSCIGHKHIQRFDPISAQRLRLVIQESTAQPQIKNFSVFFLDE